ncbi:DUF6934 family protein [Dyadobacter jiangsuensis]|uniref:Uncharacterized protein n=1 Tax=Dyadobacter jiangsuensis TaxID=1591085 RepID=A0A2P8G087_9BACT|nr:hypothetical protein [Dyadobacter jiangsuensis]PSL27374.1 hypothetical protein CLV60_108231 [Dyadobacter jiangsuensis]
MDRLLYQYLLDNSGRMFSFSSAGDKVMDKVVLFTPMETQDSYAVILGDLQNDGSIDLDITSSDGNTELVLTTVAKDIMFFLSDHPKAEVLIKGSTQARTRLYQMAIVRELSDIGRYFDIHGLTTDGLEVFQQGRNYWGFTISIKDN